MDCQATGCTNEVPKGRRKYCSDKCQERTNHAQANARSRKYYDATMRKQLPETKRRVCLRCNRRFDSEGPWNRICWRCAHLNDVVSPVRARPIKVETGDEIPRRW